MLCRITDMHNKEVINVCDGHRLGYVDDVEVDTCTAQLVSIVIRGRAKCFGLLGREEDIVICWKEIEVIGDETILVRRESSQGRSPSGRGHRILGGLFGG